MRIAIVSLHRGGMSHYAAMLARGIRAADARHSVACFVCDDVPEGLFDPAVEVFRYPVEQTSSWRAVYSVARALQTIGRLRADVTRWKPDVVHLNSGHVWYTGLLRGWDARWPIVATLHDVRVHPGEWRPYERIKLTPMFRRSRTILVHSEALREMALRCWALPPDRVRVLPMGMLAPAASGRPPLSEHPFDILLFGRVLAYKGYGLFFQALPEIVRRAPQARVTLAGAGDLTPWRTEMERHASRLRVVNQYIEDEDVPGFFEEAALVVLPYLEASQSGVAMMAAHFKKAVVATRVGSIPEAVIDRETGLLTSPDDPAALAAAIVELLEQPERRREMGQQAWSRAQASLGPSVIGGRLLEIYERVRGRGGHGG